jgi:hypothetical protein
MNTQHSLALATASSPQAENRLGPTSFDCSQQRSLDHGFEIAWLVEREESDLTGYLFNDPYFLSSQ